MMQDRLQSAAGDDETNHAGLQLLDFHTEDNEGLPPDRIELRVTPQHAVEIVRRSFPRYRDTEIELQLTI